MRQSASQNLSKQDGAVKTATFFSERFCEADWRKFQNKEAARQPSWLTDGIGGRGLCTLIFSVGPPARSETTLRPDADEDGGTEERTDGWVVEQSVTQPVDRPLRGTTREEEEEEEERYPLILDHLCPLHILLG